MPYRDILIVVSIVFGVSIIMYISKLFSDRAQYKSLLNSLGSLDLYELSDDQRKNVKVYSNESPKNLGFKIDEITSHDLDLDTFINKIDITSSILGKEYLYKAGHNMLLDLKEIELRYKKVDYFKNNSNKRVKTQMILNSISNYTLNRSFYRECQYLKEKNDKMRFYHLASLGVFVLLLVLTIINPEVFMFFLMIVGFFNLGVYFYLRYIAGFSLNEFNTLITALRSVDQMMKLNGESMSDFEADYQKLKKGLGKIKGGTWIQVSETNELIKPVAEMIFGMTHINFIKFYSMLNTFKTHFDDLEILYTILGETELAIVINNLEHSNLKPIRPTFVDEKGIEAINMVHPLIENCVPNSFELKDSNLITGSNASGKSTFIKMVALNSICAQTFGVVFSESCKLSVFKVMTSMALKDNLFEGQSYFMVEIQSLNRILKESKEIPVLGVIDEILRGTNTIERIGASAAVLKELIRQNTLILAATHDIELTQILVNEYQNKHFQESFNGDDIEFDFKLREGPSTTRNAIKLLGINGYSQDIVDEAFRSVDYFEKHNKWTNDQA